MARYRRMTLMEREEFSRMLAAGDSLRATAQVMHRAPSTLSRELTRHRTSPATYRAVPAHQRAHRWAPRPRKPRKLVVQPRLRTAVFTLLAPRWAPEQIARGLPQRYPDDPMMRISHEAIYTSLYVLPRGAFKGAPLLAAHPGPDQYRRTSQGGGGSDCPRALGGRLAGRPCQCVGTGDARGADHAAYAPGAPEGDGCGDRAARLRTRIAPAACPAPPLPHVRPGSRNAGASPLYEADQDARLFCPPPQCPWERGTNENTNGLRRQCFPKGTRFNRLSRPESKRVQVIFNDRPRKVLTWHSPAHAFHPVALGP
jgi:IS30 family transposase